MVQVGTASGTGEAKLEGSAMELRLEMSWQDYEILHSHHSRKCPAGEKRS